MKLKRRIVAVAAIFVLGSCFPWSLRIQAQEDGAENSEVAAIEDEAQTLSDTTNQSEQFNDIEISDDSDPRSTMQATDWLQLLADQVSQLTFEAIYVVTSDGKDTMPYLWRTATINGDERIEQLSLLNGPGFEQIAHDNKVSVFEPGYPPYSVLGDHVRGPIPNGLIRQPELIEQSYDAIMMGRNRIAGRMAQQIRIVSKDKTRFGYHLWIDEESGMLLKLNTYDLDSQLIEQVQVAQLTIDDTVGQQFANFKPEYMPDIQPYLSHQQRELAWDISFFPVGMKVVRKSLHRIQRTGQLAEYMLLSDGLIDVSVYLFEANPAFDQEVSWQSGQNSVVTRTNGQVQVTVLGKLPADTANKIADSIVLVDKARP